MSQADAHELAAVLLGKARGDRAGVAALLDHTDVPDHVVGFLAQQAVEKALKAVLTQRGVVFGRRHDLDYLVELLGEDASLENVALDAVSDLAPWAVEMRYELADAPQLDREETLTLVETLLAWAESQVPT